MPGSTCRVGAAVGWAWPPACRAPRGAGWTAAALEQWLRRRNATLRVPQGRLTPRRTGHPRGGTETSATHPPTLVRRRVQEGGQRAAARRAAMGGTRQERMRFGGGSRPPADWLLCRHGWRGSRFGREAGGAGWALSLSLPTSPPRLRWTRLIVPGGRPEPVPESVSEPVPRRFPRPLPPPPRGVGRKSSQRPSGDDENATIGLAGRVGLRWRGRRPPRRPSHGSRLRSPAGREEPAHLVTRRDRRKERDDQRVATRRSPFTVRVLPRVTTV